MMYFRLVLVCEKIPVRYCCLAAGGRWVDSRGMAVVRSLLDRFSRDGSSDLKVGDNIVCLSDYDRVIDDPAEDFVNNGPSDLPKEFTLGIEPEDSPHQTLGELMTRTR